MKRAAIAALLLVMAGTTLATAQTAGPSPASGPLDRGSSIANLISSAIDVALPGVTKLIDAVVGIFRPRPAEKAQLTEQVKTEVEKAVAQAKTEFYTKIKPGIGAIGTEVETVTSFGVPASAALVEIASLQAGLKGKTTLDGAERANLKAGWRKVKGNLDQATHEQTAKTITDKVKDTHVQGILLAVVSMQNTGVAAAETLINDERASVEDIRNALAEIRAPLEGIGTATVLEASRLGKDLQALGNADQKKLTGDSHLALTGPEEQLYLQTIRRLGGKG